MLEINFYKIRTGLDIRPLNGGGDQESQLRYDQILQLIAQKAEIEFLNPMIVQVEENKPKDLKFYTDKVPVYVMIFGVNKNMSSWTSSALNLALGNMHLPARILSIDSEADQWIGGNRSNISCSAAYFDLRHKKK